MSGFENLIPFPTFRRELELAGATRVEAKAASRSGVAFDNLDPEILDRWEEIFCSDYWDLSPQQMKVQADFDRSLEEAEVKEERQSRNYIPQRFKRSRKKF